MSQHYSLTVTNGCHRGRAHQAILYCLCDLSIKAENTLKFDETHSNCYQSFHSQFHDRIDKNHTTIKKMVFLMVLYEITVVSIIY